MSHFIIKSLNKLDDLPVGTRIEESDYSVMTPSGCFVQMEYVETEEVEMQPYPVNPGVWSIQKVGGRFVLLKTSFVKDDILSSFIHTKEITDKINSFFNKLDIYKKYGIEIPKRGILLYGPPGSGKTTVINRVVELYSSQERTAIVVWPTDKFEAHEVKDFIKSFSYEKVDKLILVAEDIGGTEIDNVRMRSDSSLLSLLDNQEKTFKTPILIIATTNFPEVFLGNLTNRPQRFDDKIEVGYPLKEARSELLKFFAKEEISEEVVSYIQSKACEKFSPAHIKECVIRSAIYDKTLLQTLKEIAGEIASYEKAFSKTKSVGFGLDE
jgi:SpoVK/Ycf46/Vps4 family AAA+-type ATPase